VALPLTHGAKRIPKAQVRDRVMYALSLVQMERYADRPVPHLSGGQQQRVALARSLAVEPVVLLMDEPLSNLDARLREEVRHQILTATKMVGVTVLYVTHDQSEALALGDKVAVMDAGQVIQVGEPNTLFSSPATPMVAEFLGQVNWLKGHVTQAGVIDTAIGAFGVKTDGMTGAVQIGIRPSSIELRSSATGAPNEVSGEIIQETFLGDLIQLKIRLATDVVFEVRAQKLFRGQLRTKQVFCQLEESELLIYPVH
jgi:ABC-type Fe3+/spermidine/putrescine transport system ATPase subunit